MDCLTIPYQYIKEPIAISARWGCGNGQVTRIQLSTKYSR